MPNGNPKSAIPDPRARPTSSASALLRQIAVAKAAALARAGRTDEAEELLAGTAEGEGATPAALDLLARIRAQQGRLAEAAALWTRASQLSPDNEACRLALERIVRMYRRPVWLPSLAHGLLALAVVACVALIAIATLRRVAALEESLRTEIARSVGGRGATDGGREGPDSAALVPRTPSRLPLRLRAELARMAARQAEMAKVTTALAAAAREAGAAIEKAKAAQAAALDGIRTEVAKAATAQAGAARETGAAIEKAKAEQAAALNGIRTDVAKAATAQAGAARETAAAIEKAKAEQATALDGIRTEVAKATTAQAAAVRGIQAEAEKAKAAREELAERLVRKPPDVKVDLPGVVLTTEQDELVISFGEGLFGAWKLFADRRATLTPDAAALLTRLGQQLEPHAARISLRVIGLAGASECGDSASPARAREELARERANAVARHMAQTTKLPARVFAIGAGGTYLNPYPDDTRENRARNRTVLIRVSEGGR